MPRARTQRLAQFTSPFHLGERLELSESRVYDRGRFFPESAGDFSGFGLTVVEVDERDRLGMH